MLRASFVDFPSSVIKGKLVFALSRFLFFFFFFFFVGSSLTRFTDVNIVRKVVECCVGFGLERFLCSVILVTALFRAFFSFFVFWIVLVLCSRCNSSSCL
jgi:hypothetical protein